MVRSSAIRTLSYNIWFERTDQKDRLDSIVQILIDADADFVCLQEVTSVSREFILSSQIILQRYPFYTCNQLGGYGTMILTKHPCWFFELDYTFSAMGRSLLVAEPINGINGRQVLVATSHFESCNNQSKRKAQMREAFALLGGG